MADIIKFDVTCDDLLELADKAFEEHDIVRHVDYLKRALKQDPAFHEASLRLAQTYAMLGVHEISNDVIYRALNLGVDEDMRAAFYAQLAMNFLDADDAEVAEYYIRDYSDEYDINYPENGSRTNGLKFVDQHDESRDEEIISRAYQLVSDRRFDDAIALMDRVSPNSKYRETANHIVLICLMLQNNVDAVIDNAKAMLEKYGDSLLIKCTLASAYMMEDRLMDAYAIAEEVIATDHTRIDDILLILPILVNLDMHSQVIKYTRRILAQNEWHPNTMIWLAIALYNIGQKAEATRVMRQVDTIYGEYSPASYFLRLFATSPDSVEYSLNLPRNERMLRIRRAEELLRMPFAKLKETLCDESANGDSVRELIDWVMDDGGEELRCVLAKKLALLNDECTEGMFRRYLIKSGISYELFSVMFISLLDAPEPILRVNIVAQDRYKEMRIFKPLVYFKTPMPLKGAIKVALTDIAFTDEEPEEYIDALFEICKKIVPLDENLQPIKTKRLQKICRLRSFQTMEGVLLGKVYENDETREEIIARYGLNPRTYDKYYKIFFGEEDGGEN